MLKSEHAPAYIQVKYLTYDTYYVPIKVSYLVTYQRMIRINIDWTSRAVVNTQWYNIYSIRISCTCTAVQTEIKCELKKISNRLKNFEFERFVSLFEGSLMIVRKYLCSTYIR